MITGYSKRYKIILINSETKLGNQCVTKKLNRDKDLRKGPNRSLIYDGFNKSNKIIETKASTKKSKSTRKLLIRINKIAAENLLPLEVGISIQLQETPRSLNRQVLKRPREFDILVKL